jgi:hypothetical protein
VPLDPLQDLIARTALALPEARTLALAGGGAMIAHGFVSRLTHDVDLFTEVDDHEAVLVAAALRTALERLGLTTIDAERPPLDHRFVAVDPANGQECLVEVFADGGRLQRRVALAVGNVLHPDDLDWAEDGIDANAIDDLRSTFAGWHRTLATTETD